MSAPAAPTTPSTPPGGAAGPAAGARRYAAAVRAHLDDLPAEVVDDLTSGLEADLAEMAAEAERTPEDLLGPARACAAELREAAGLPPRRAGAPAAGAAPLGFAGAADELVGGVRDALAALRAQRWWPGAVERARQLRPAWWVLRGVVVAWALLALSDLDRLGPVQLLLALLCVAGSVELGRRRPGGHQGRVVVGLADAVCAVLVLPLLLAATDGPRVVYADPVPAAATSSDGVWVDGRAVSNLFPFDAQGRPLQGVRLLTDFGTAVETGTDQRADYGSGVARQLLPAVTTDGRVGWTAFPLRVGSPDGGYAPAQDAPLPQPSLLPLVALPSAADETSAAPAATDAPSSAATPTATATPSASPTATATATATITATATATAVQEVLPGTPVVTVAP